MPNFDILIQNPELAKSVKFEITGADLLLLAGAIIKATREAETIETRKGEVFVKVAEASAQLRKDKSTLHRWHLKGLLKHNALGLYKQSDITAILNK